MLKLKLLLCNIAAIAVLAVVSSTAGAFRATTSPAGNMSMVSAALTFGEEPEIICMITLRGTLAGSYGLIANERIGSIMEVRITSCSANSMERVLGLSWPIAFQSTLGSLPDAASGLVVKIAGVAYNWSTWFGAVNCLYSGDVLLLIALTHSGTNSYGYSTGRVTGEPNLPFRAGSVFCPEEQNVRGTFRVEPPQSMTVS